MAGSLVIMGAYGRFPWYRVRRRWHHVRSTSHTRSGVGRGAPWPLETVVMTTESGMITSIIYRAVLNLPMPGEVSFKKSIGLLSG